MATKTIEMNVRKDNGGYEPLHPKLKSGGVIFDNSTTGMAPNRLNGALDLTVSGVSNVSTDMNGAVLKENSMVITANNISVTSNAWVSDSTYSDYPYRADITINGCTNKHIPDVYFDVDNAISGKFSPIASSAKNMVSIWASAKPTSTTTIPTIKLICKSSDVQTTPDLSSIRIYSTPQTEFDYGDQFNCTGLQLEATYVDNTKRIISTGFTTSIAPGTKLKLSDSQVTVTYSEYEITKTVNYSISVTSEYPLTATWANGSDTEIVALVNALDQGKLTTDDLVWSVGDSRTVSLGAMSAVSPLTDTHDAQSVELVIMNVGGKTMQNGNTCHYIVGQKNLLTNTGMINGTATNTGGWTATPRRTWCNEQYYNAIPSTLRPIFKKFNVVTANGNGTSTTTDVDYFTLPSEKEVRGTCTYANTTAESSLSQFTYYATSNNRIKKKGSTNTQYWTRSPRKSTNTQAFVAISTSGSYASSNANTTTNGLAPYGVI